MVTGVGYAVLKSEEREEAARKGPVVLPSAAELAAVSARGNEELNQRARATIVGKIRHLAEAGRRSATFRTISMENQEWLRSAGYAIEIIRGPEASGLRVTW